MKSTLKKWKITGFIFAAILGVLLHFLYDYTGENRFVAIFSAVNESTWEHTKLLFFPMIIFSIVEARYNEDRYKNFWWANLLGTIAGVLAIPILFYTLNGAFGKTPDIINILIFFVSDFIAYYVQYKITNTDKKGIITEGQSFFVLCFIAVIYVVFTFYPPEFPLFQDPISGIYGI